MKRVTYIFPISHRFRYPFHEALRERLARHGVEYNVVYCDPFGVNILKNDTVDLPWGRKVPIIKIGPALIQCAFSDVLRSDLVIIQQENKLILNYFCQILHMAGIKKIAFFGHGRNLQAGNPHSFFERWKRFWATKTGWWFAYTPSTKAYLMKLGYPAEKITVFYNSIDISHIRSDLQNLREEDIIRARSRVSVQGNNVAVYVGGIYREKRIRFLLEAAVEIRKIVPDFELIVVGGGDEAHLITEASHLYDWIKYTGPLFGAEKTAVVKLAKVFLMPGLVGLAILDAFAYGIPLVTSDLPYHSPEIDYLDNGVNGVMTMDPDDVSEYAQAVSEILTNEVHRQELIEGGSRSLSALGIERMSERFAEGVLKALSQ